MAFILLTNVVLLADTGDNRTILADGYREPRTDTRKDLCPWLRGSVRRTREVLSVPGSVRQEFLFVFHCNYGHILHRFQAKTRYWSKNDTFYRTILYIARTMLIMLLKNVYLSVCPFVCHRRYFETAKRIMKLLLNIGLPHHSSFSIPNGMQYSDGKSLTWAPNAIGYKNRDFQPTSHFILKMIQNTPIVSIECE